MATGVKNNTSWGVEIEVTEGTYVEPAAATSFVQALKDGSELSPAKELLERNIFTSSIGRTRPRVGQFQVSGALPVEARANSTAGAAPEYDALLRACLGTRRQISTTTTTKASGNTATRLQIEDADISKFNVGDIVMTKASGAYHVSPVTAKVTTGGAAYIDLLVAHPSGDHADSVVIEKASIYTVADSGHPSLSISKYIEGAVLEKATGCRVSSLSLDSFATGQLPSMNFAFQGLDYDSSVTAIPHTPSYNTGVPPIILSAYVYMDGSEIQVNEVTLNIENTLGFKTATSAPNGRISSRITDRVITGTMLPYKSDDSVALFTKYDANTAFSVFGYAAVPTGVAGQFGQVVAFYAPNCIITELGESDQDGLLQQPVTFSVDRGSAGTSNELYLAFI